MSAGGMGVDRTDVARNGELSAALTCVFIIFRTGEFRVVGPSVRPRPTSPHWLLSHAANAVAGGGRGRDCPTKASRQLSSASSAAVPRARVPRALTPRRPTSTSSTYTTALAACLGGVIESIYVGTKITTDMLEDNKTEITCDLKGL